MSAVTIRKLAEETHRTLKQRAARHGHSTEVEIRQILDETVRSKNHPRIGPELATFGKKHGGLDLDSPTGLKPARAGILGDDHDKSLQTN